MKSRQWIRAWIILVLLAGSTFPGTPLDHAQVVHAQDTAIVSINPPAGDVILNNTLTVSIDITGGGDNNNGFDVIFSYDPNLLTLVSYSLGTYLTIPIVFSWQDPNNHPGWYHLAYAVKFPASSPNGSLLNLVFRGTSYGLSAITLESVILGTPQGLKTYPIRQNGALSVHGNPAQPYTLTGTFKMQGRINTGGIPVSLSKVNWFGPFSATTTNLPANNLTINPVYGDIYRITTNQPRYLNVTADLNKTKTITASTTLSTLLLRGGNAVWTDNIIDTYDLSLVAGAFGGPNLAADVNFSGKVDLFDLTLVAGNYGLTSATAYQSWTP